MPLSIAPPASCIAHPVVVPRSSARIVRCARPRARGIALESAVDVTSMSVSSLKWKFVTALPVDGRLAANAGDSRAGEFLFDGKDAVAERLDQDRDLGCGEHAAFACDVMGFLLAAHERDDF